MLVLRLDAETIVNEEGPLVLDHVVEAIVWPPFPVAVPVTVSELVGN